MAAHVTPRSEILAQMPAARARTARARRQGLRAVAVEYDVATGRIMMELTNGFVFGFPVGLVPALAGATPRQIKAVELSAGGGALRWDALDADLSVPGLLLSSIGRTQKLTELARLAGQATSPAKAAASRANGAKGGRPRKV